MSDLYRLTELGEQQAEPLDGLVEFVITKPALVELIRATITERKAFDTARQIGESVATALGLEDSE